MKRAEDFTEEDYRRLKLSAMRYFRERHNRLLRCSEDGLVSKLGYFRARKYAKDLVREVREGKRICVADIYTSDDISFMTGKISRSGVALLMNCFVRLQDDKLTSYSRRQTLELYKAFSEEASKRGATRLVAVSDVRDNVFINAIETMDFEELNWGRHEVRYGKRISLSDDKKC